ncbi:hypothetical protein Q1695_000723 [Nippostrongylus brasiliensis]|nr:hypothetical protein Q1695_000723 [Nippostrongylus brasiliensis]
MMEMASNATSTPTKFKRSCWHLSRPRETFADVADYADVIITDLSYGCTYYLLYDVEDSLPMVFSTANSTSTMSDEMDYRVEQQGDEDENMYQSKDDDFVLNKVPTTIPESHHEPIVSVMKWQLERMGGV